jgi:hypothetical protein
VAAKLTPRLTTAMAESSLAGLLMRAGATRKDDEFVEIFIYAAEGLETRDVDLVTVQRAPMTPEEGHRRDLVRGACAARARAIRVMLVAEAFVSGAVFRDDSALRILDAPQAEPREALPNELYWFRHARARGCTGPSGWISRPN